MNDSVSEDQVASFELHLYFKEPVPWCESEWIRGLTCDFEVRGQGLREGDEWTALAYEVLDGIEALAVGGPFAEEGCILRGRVSWQLTKQQVMVGTQTFFPYDWDQIEECNTWYISFEEFHDLRDDNHWNVVAAEQYNLYEVLKTDNLPERDPDLEDYPGRIMILLIPVRRRPVVGAPF